MIKYILAFKHPKNNSLMFLAHNQSVEDLCYKNSLELQGTDNPYLAKLYDSEEEAKKDLFLIKYHRREFLKINISIKKVLNFRNIDVLSYNDNIKSYYISELIESL